MGEERSQVHAGGRPSRAAHRSGGVLLAADGREAVQLARKVHLRREVGIDVGDQWDPVTGLAPNQRVRDSVFAQGPPSSVLPVRESTPSEELAVARNSPQRHSSDLLVRSPGRFRRWVSQRTAIEVNPLDSGTTRAIAIRARSALRMAAATHMHPNPGRPAPPESHDHSRPESRRGCLAAATGSPC